MDSYPYTHGCPVPTPTDPLTHCQAGVGTIAVNDSFLIESAIYRILKKHFTGRPIYLNLIELLHEVGQRGNDCDIPYHTIPYHVSDACSWQTTYQTELGQMLDLITAPPGQVDFSKFTLAK